MKRRTFLVAASAFILGGCVDPGLSPNDQGIVNKYYPELSNYPLREKSTASADGTEALVFNFSHLQMDVEAIKATFLFFSSLAKQRQQYSTDYRGQTYQLSIQPEVFQRRVVFFVPQQTPSPSWPSLVVSHFAESINFGDGTMLSYIRVPSSADDTPADFRFAGPIFFANSAFIAEACQSTVATKSQPSQPFLETEVVCNSWESALRQKRRGFVYGTYQLDIQNTTSQPPWNMGFSPLLLSKEEYDKLPVLPPALTIQRRNRKNDWQKLAGFTNRQVYNHKD